MNVLLIAQYYYEENEKELITKCKGNVSAAHHKLVDNIYNSLKLNGCNVNLLTTLPVGNFPRRCNTLAFSTHKKSFGYEIGFINLPIIKHKNREKNISKYVDLWLDDKKDEKNVILIYDLYPPFFNSLISKTKKKNVIIVPIIPDIPGPLCIEFKTYNFITKKYKTCQYKAIKKKLQAVDASVVLTKYMTEPLEINDKKSLVIEGIVDDDLDLKTNEIYPHETINILYAGELSKTIGIDLLLDAFSLLDEDKMYILHICGKGDAEEDIKKLRKDNIIYHGFLNKNDMNKLEKIIDIYINPRTNNGDYVKYSFPSKNLEYLKTGKPVIAFKLDGIPDEYDKYLNYPSEETPESIKNKIIEVSNRNVNTVYDKMKQQLEFIKTKSIYNQGKRLLNFLEEI